MEKMSGKGLENKNPHITDIIMYEIKNYINLWKCNQLKKYYCGTLIKQNNKLMLQQSLAINVFKEYVSCRNLFL